MKEERLLDLLAKRATRGLDESESRELVELESMFPEWAQDESFELSAAAVNLINLDTSEPLPAHLESRILADAERFFAEKGEAELQKTFEFEPKSNFFQWLGWAVAGVASIALAFSLWVGVQSPPQAKIDPPKALTASELRDLLVSSGAEISRVSFSDPKETAKVVGDVVWSDREQKGYMRFNGLAKNDTSKETYQLWIFDETQDEKTPVDGGVFDIAENGDVVIPIDAKLRVKNPKLFAVTVEKPGGVVVSKREKIVAVAKVAA